MKMRFRPIPRRNSVTLPKFEEMAETEIRHENEVRPISLRNSVTLPKFVEIADTARRVHCNSPRLAPRQYLDQLD